jgi:hypothetical protein
MNMGRILQITARVPHVHLLLDERLIPLLLFFHER